VYQPAPESGKRQSGLQLGSDARRLNPNAPIDLDDAGF